MAKWLMSKAVWSAVGLIALGVADALEGNYETAAQRALEALGFLGLRHALWKAAS